MFPEGSRPDDKRCVPLELKVLAALRMLAVGASFDNISELACISEQTVQSFFHKWCEAFAANEFTKWCHPPTTSAEVAETTGIFARCGFPGCVGSIDVVHVPWDRCLAVNLRARLVSSLIFYLEETKNKGSLCQLSFKTLEKLLRLVDPVYAVLMTSRLETRDAN